MTNRQKLLTTSEYDLLVKMNDALLGEYEAQSQHCILDVITEKDNSCRERSIACDCEECIQKWLNEEAN